MVSSARPREGKHLLVIGLCTDFIEIRPIARSQLQDIRRAVHHDFALVTGSNAEEGRPCGSNPLLQLTEQRRRESGPARVDGRTALEDSPMRLFPLINQRERIIRLSAPALACRNRPLDLERLVLGIGMSPEVGTTGLETCRVENDGERSVVTGRAGTRAAPDVWTSTRRELPAG